MEVAELQIPTLRKLGGARAAGLILFASAALVGFLVWLLYFKASSGYTSSLIASLPAINATLNAISAALLIAGYVAVKQKLYLRHVKFMFAALASSTVFFVSYVVYHNFHGDTKFTGVGAVRPVYFFILISHIVLSAVVVPMILTSLYLSLSGRMAAHKRVSKWTFPIWLYVSVTGVLIFAMLKLFV